jgi:hypothetical protein
MTDTVRLTYRELAERLGIEPDSARIKAKRHAKSGRWKIIPGNHPGATATVEVPVADLVRGSAPVRTPLSAPVRTEGSAPERPGAEIQALQDHIETLKGLLLAEVERTQRARDEAEEARIEADQAKADQVRMARDVTMMFDELKTMADRHAEMHAERARLQAELEQARRRWWHRWLKR